MSHYLGWERDSTLELLYRVARGFGAVRGLWSWNRFTCFTADVVPTFCGDFFSFSLESAGMERGFIIAENGEYCLLLPLVLLSLVQEMVSWQNEVCKRFNAWHSLPSTASLHSQKNADIGEGSPVIAILA